MDITTAGGNTTGEVGNCWCCGREAKIQSDLIRSNRFIKQICLLRTVVNMFRKTEEFSYWGWNLFFDSTTVHPLLSHYVAVFWLIKGETLQVNRGNISTNIYHNETSPVDYLHWDNHFLYYKFSEIQCFKYTNEASSNMC